MELHSYLIDPHAMNDWWKLETGKARNLFFFAPRCCFHFFLVLFFIFIIIITNIFTSYSHVCLKIFLKEIYMIEAKKTI